MADILLRATQLSKQYGEGEHAVRVLENLDLALRPAERTAIIGESGVGEEYAAAYSGYAGPSNLGTRRAQRPGPVWPA